MDFYQTIDQVRQLQGFTYKRLAKGAGMSNATAWRICHGQTKPTVEAADAVCKTLGFKWLIGDKTSRLELEYRPTIKDLEKLLQDMGGLDGSDITFVATFVREKVKQSSQKSSGLRKSDD